VCHHSVLGHWDRSEVEVESTLDTATLFGGFAWGDLTF
jgi:hypothetical protein